jgi:uncharacterized protein YkwD
MKMITLGLMATFLFTGCIEKNERRTPASPRLEREVYVDRAATDAPALEERTYEKKEITEQAQLLDFVNDHREKLGLGRLLYSEEIEVSAQNHSVRMSRKYFPFGHMGSTLRCRRILRALGLDKGSLCGENVAMGQETPEEAYLAWINSPEHREAIEDERYTHTGLGIYRDGGGVIYWTQIFIQIN